MTNQKHLKRLNQGKSSGTSGGKSIQRYNQISAEPYSSEATFAR